MATKLALGTVQFGLKYGVANTAGKVSEAEARDILSLARAGGITTLDTAIAYGESEVALGVQGVSEWNVVTKLPELPPEIQTSVQVSDWVQDQVSASLARLRLSCAYAILLHRPDQILSSKGEALLSALVELKLQGFIGKVGVSMDDTIRCSPRHIPSSSRAAANSRRSGA